MSIEVILDKDRQARTGLAEAVFAAGKSPSQLQTICADLTANEGSMLFTRLDPAQYEALETDFPGLIDYCEVSATGWVRPAPIQAQVDVAIVSGGSSAVPVTREAARTLEFYGYPSLAIDDIGVAGLWRMLQRVEEIGEKRVVICVAGMDAALPTVMGGLIKSVLIAVPTSVGYGATIGGETALRSLLVSCAPGVTVVNIDNGFGAACAALRVLNQLGRVT